MFTVLAPAIRRLHRKHRHQKKAHVLTEDDDGLGVALHGHGPWPSLSAWDHVHLRHNEPLGRPRPSFGAAAALVCPAEGCSGKFSLNTSFEHQVGDFQARGPVVHRPRRSGASFQSALTCCVEFVFEFPGAAPRDHSPQIDQMASLRRSIGIPERPVVPVHHGDGKRAGSFAGRMRTRGG